MSGCAMLVVLLAVRILIMAQELRKTRKKMQSLPYNTENAKYHTKGKRLVRAKY